MVAYGRARTSADPVVGRRPVISVAGPGSPGPVRHAAVTAPARLAAMRRFCVPAWRGPAALRDGPGCRWVAGRRAAWDRLGCDVIRGLCVRAFRGQPAWACQENRAAVTKARS